MENSLGLGKRRRDRSNTYRAKQHRETGNKRIVQKCKQIVNELNKARVQKTVINGNFPGRG